jgi:hypothetical protein
MERLVANNNLRLLLIGLLIMTPVTVLVAIATTKYTQQTAAPVKTIEVVVPLKSPKAEQCERIMAMLNGGVPSKYEKECAE